jgi:RNA polymerase sigma-70 factor (ECF subfamily)
MSYRNGIVDNTSAELYKTLQPKLYYYCRKFIRDEHEASGIVQEAFTKLLENAGTIEIHTSIEGYLMRMVHNLSMNYLRDNKAKRTSNLDRLSHLEMAYWEENGYDSLLFKDMENLINNKVEKLPPENRKIFKMSRFQGLSNAEIASRLGISVRTVENQIYRSLKKLKELLVGEI